MIESRFSSQRLWFLPFILFPLILVGLTWVNYRFTIQNPGGNDFLVHWVGTRNLLIDGDSPYSDETAVRIQTMAYGRPARPGEHELRVAYPLYSGILFTPFALFGNYSLARALWMTMLESAIIGLAFLCLRMVNWKIHGWMLLVYLIFALLWYHAVRPLINGNAVILVALFIAGAFEAIRHGRDEIAGILLALSTIKPQVVVLIVPFILIWAITAKRWKILIWLLIALVVLTVSAMIFIVDWPLQNLVEVLRYPGYNPPGTPGAAFTTWWPILGSRLGWGLTIVLGIVLCIEWYLARGRDYQWFLWTACLTLAISQWIGIQTDPGNFIVLFIPVVLILATWEERWGIKRGRPVVTASILLLFIGIWAIFMATVEYGDQPQQAPIMFFPLPFLMLLGLYWVRWWAIKPGKTLIEALRASEDL